MQFLTTMPALGFSALELPHKKIEARRAILGQLLAPAWERIEREAPSPITDGSVMAGLFAGLGLPLFVVEKEVGIGCPWLDLMAAWKCGATWDFAAGHWKLWSWFGFITYPRVIATYSAAGLVRHAEISDRICWTACDIVKEDLKGQFWTPFLSPRTGEYWRNFHESYAPA